MGFAVAGACEGPVWREGDLLRMVQMGRSRRRLSADRARASGYLRGGP